MSVARLTVKDAIFDESGDNILWVEVPATTTAEVCDACGGRLFAVGFSHDPALGRKREWECADCGVSRWDALR